MRESLVTALQLFSIGIGLGFSGLCLFSCAPILLSFSAGRGKPWLEAMGDTAVFLSGRLAAYVVLGAIAGMSSALLYRFTGASFSAGARMVSSLLSICLGIFILFFSGKKKCGKSRERAGQAGLLLAGFALGISPCVPLFALLFEIMLITHNPFSAAAYAFAFGLGTFVAGIGVFAMLTMIAVRFPLSFVSSPRALFWVRAGSGFFLVALGIVSIITR